MINGLRDRTMSRHEPALRNRRSSGPWIHGDHGMKRRRSYLAVILVITGAASALSIAAASGEKSHAEVAGAPSLKANADALKHTIVTPHLEQGITGGMNVLWCSTFQLAWNELCELNGGAVNMTPSSSMVSILNKKGSSKKDLNEESYVAMAGLADEGIYEKIRKALADKFKGHAEPELFDSTPRMGWVVYAYLFKELPFRWAFTRFHENLGFDGYLVDSFGIAQFLDDQADEVKMAGQVVVLDHKNNDEFIVELKSRSPDDRLILAKVPPQKTLAATIAAVERRVAGATPSHIREMEDLFIPVLNFDILRRYPELCSRPIRSPNKRLDGTGIGLAAQSIRFRLDERGAVLKSEVVFAKGETPRNLVFDKPFLILLKRREAAHPYFALWVGNAELLAPANKKRIEG